MNALDWVLAGIALFCVGRGILRGAVSQVFGIAGILGGFYLASHHYENLAVEVSRAFPGLTGPHMVSFVVLFFLTWFCVAILGFIMARILHRSGLGFMDRFLGAGVGLGKAVVLAIIIISSLTFFLSPRQPFLCESCTAPYLQEIARFAVKATPVSVQNLFERKRDELKRYWLERDESGSQLLSKEKRKARPGE